MLEAVRLTGLLRANSLGDIQFSALYGLVSWVRVRVIFHPTGGRLHRTFVVADRFVTPVYVAFLAQEISIAEFDDIKAKVKVDFKTLANVMDNLLTYSKNR